MLSPEFKEALKLLGGKTALSDEDGCYIIMTLEEFKKIKRDEAESLTKKGPIDKINSDVNLWKNSEGKKGGEGASFSAPKEKEEEIKYIR